MLVVIVAALLAAAPSRDGKSGMDADRLQRLTGGRAQRSPSDTVTVDVPRDDLDVYVGKVHLKPAQGLVARATFQKLKSGSRVAGEMVLLDDQVAPAIAAALDGRLEVTSLDRHFLHESPRLTYLRVQGTGDDAALGAAIGKLFEIVRSKTSSAPHLAEVDLMGGSLDAHQLSAACGGGQLSGGVFVSERPRSVVVRGEALAPGMGAESWVALAGTSDQASASGAIVATTTELSSVLGSLRSGGLEVTAIEPVPSDSQPEVRRVYFFGSGAADTLAHGYKSALDSTAAK